MNASKQQIRWFTGRRFLELMRRNLDAPIYPRNRVDILQNATEKYPRLLRNLQAAARQFRM